jgi:hypothetical protein
LATQIFISLPQREKRAAFKCSHQITGEWVNVHMRPLYPFSLELMRRMCAGARHPINLTSRSQMLTLSHFDLIFNGLNFGAGSNFELVYITQSVSCNMQHPISKKITNSDFFGSALHKKVNASSHFAHNIIFKSPRANLHRN